MQKAGTSIYSKKRHRERERYYGINARRLPVLCVIKKIRDLLISRKLVTW